MGRARRACARRVSGTRAARATRRSPRAPGPQIRGVHEDEDAPPPDWHWKGIVREVRGPASDRVILSSEFLAHARDEAIRAMIADLERDRIHVVIRSARSRGCSRRCGSSGSSRAAPGRSRRGSRPTSGADGELPDRSLWHQHRHDRLVERWAGSSGRDRVSAVVVDSADHAWLLRAVEGRSRLRR